MVGQQDASPSDSVGRRALVWPGVLLVVTVISYWVAFQALTRQPGGKFVPNEPLAQAATLLGVVAVAALATLSVRRVTRLWPDDGNRLLFAALVGAGMSAFLHIIILWKVEWLDDAFIQALMSAVIGGLALAFALGVGLGGSRVDADPQQRRRWARWPPLIAAVALAVMALAAGWDADDDWLWGFLMFLGAPSAALVWVAPKLAMIPRGRADAWTLALVAACAFLGGAYGAGNLYGAVMTHRLAEDIRAIGTAAIGAPLALLMTAVALRRTRIKSQLY